MKIPGFIAGLVACALLALPIPAFASGGDDTRIAFAASFIGIGITGLFLVALLARRVLTGFQSAFVVMGFLAMTAMTLAACTGNLAADSANIVATAKANEPLLFQQGCAAVSVADGAFQAASPALVVAGKLSADSVAKEQAIFRLVQATCATPPADLASAGLQLLAQASTIYLLLVTPPS